MATRHHMAPCSLNDLVDLLLSPDQSTEPVLLKPQKGPLPLACPREDQGILSLINLSLLSSFFFPPAMKLQPLRTLLDSLGSRFPI